MNERVKFLLVDDDEGVAEFFKNFCNTLGYELDYVYTAKEAIKKFKTNYYNIIFIDIRLSDGNGLDVLRKFRRIQKSKSQKSLFVMITGEATPEEIHKSYYSEGAYTCICKPFKLEKLIPLVKLLLEVDPASIEGKKVNGRKIGWKKYIIYILIIGVTAISAFVFLNFQYKEKKISKKNPNIIWKFIQNQFKIIEGYLERDEQREIINQ